MGQIKGIYLTNAASVSAYGALDTRSIPSECPLTSFELLTMDGLSIYPSSPDFYLDNKNSYGSATLNIALNTV